ncbi:MAG: DUF975 family protein [Lachnospiraceae bacterium]|jgi:hypothetical protein
MWDRQTLKWKGRNAIRVNYLKCLLMAFMIAILVEGGYSSYLNYTTESDQEEQQDNDIIPIEELEEQYGLTAEQAQQVSNLINQLDSSGIYSILENGFTVPTLVLLLLTIFVFNVLEIGGDRFFVGNARAADRQQTDGGPSLGEISYAFRSGNYGTMALGMFMRKLFIMLWSMLFVIPGIIKSYEYRMVPYIMAEHPEISWQEAFRRSREMMYGSKWDAFVLDLSFIGWQLLSFFSFGIIGILYSNPYYYATCAELYRALSGENTNAYGGGNGWDNGGNGWDNGGSGWDNNNGSGWDNNNGSGWDNNSGNGWNNNNGNGWNNGQ